MISVHKDFLDIPKVLQNVSERESAWKHESVLRKLKEIYHGKCAYCEKKTLHLIVNHYRPIKLYPWLSNEWSNLLPVCEECKNAKGDSFEVNGIRIKSKPKSNSENSADSESLKNEKPKLLHPEVDTPENYFYFDELEIKGFKKRGEDTVKLMNLNRQDLIEERYKLYDLFIIQELLQRTNISLDLNIFTQKTENIQERKNLLLEFLQSDNIEFSAIFNSIFIELLSRGENSQPHSFFVQSSLMTFQEISRTLNILPQIVSLFLGKIDSENYLQDYSPFIKNWKDITALTKKAFCDSVLSYYGVNKELLQDSNQRLLTFHIHKFNIINNLKIGPIQPNAQWIFLTGENGFGKTTLLRALFIGFTGGGDIQTNKIDDNTRIKIVFQNAFNKRTELAEFGSYNYDPFDFVCAYGPSRTRLSPHGDKSNLSDSLFGNSDYVLDFESRFKEMEGFEELKKERKYIVEILKRLIPNLHSIEIRPDKTTKGTHVVYFEKTETGEILPPVEFDQLAMGMRSIIGFITDMIFRLSKYQSLKKELTGIVFIDEFDIHLHPKWQRRTVEKLTEIFPRIQFIVSTHSEIPLLGAPENSVVLKVNRTKEEGITAEKLDIDFSELPVDNILSSPIFDFHDVIPVSYKPGKRLRTEQGYDDVEFYKILEEKIQNIAKESGIEYKKDRKK